MKKIWKRVALTFAVIFGSYSLAIGLGTVWPTGEEKNGEYTVYLTSGQIHTEFVFDLQSSPIDWPAFIPVESINPSLTNIRYISIGWGDRRFFYELLDWSDLTFDLAFSALFLPGESAVHVEYASELNSALKHYPLKLNAEDYQKLFSFIKSSFALKDGRVQKIDEFNYYENDRFFHGTGSYHLFNTCNMWT